MRTQLFAFLVLCSCTTSSAQANAPSVGGLCPASTDGGASNVDSGTMSDGGAPPCVAYFSGGYTGSSPCTLSTDKGTDGHAYMALELTLKPGDSPQNIFSCRMPSPFVAQTYGPQDGIPPVDDGGTECEIDLDLEPDAGILDWECLTMALTSVVPTANGYVVHGSMDATFGGETPVKMHALF